MRYVCVQRYQDRYKITQGRLVVNHLHRHTSIPQHLQRHAVGGLHSVQTLFVIIKATRSRCKVKLQAIAHVLCHEARCYRTFTLAVASRAGASLMSKPSRFTLVASSL